MNVYVAAAFTDVWRVHGVHVELERRGLRWTSSWVAAADGQKEELVSLSPEQRYAIAEENDSGVRRADIVILLASPEAKEAFCEARFACELGKLVLWVGEPLPLTAYRRNVERFASPELALSFLSGLAGRRPDVARRWGLPRLGT